MAAEVVGVPRIREALEVNDWAADESTDVEGLDVGSDEGEDGFGGFEVEEAQMEREFVDMKTALNGGDGVREALGETDDGDGETQVEELERMMLKLQTVRGKLWYQCFICKL